MNRRRLALRLGSLLAFATALAALAGPARAATIAAWDQFGQPGNQAFTPGVGSPDVTATSMVRGPSLAASAAANSLSSSGWSGNDAGDYFELGFDVAGGYSIVLDELIIGTRSSATGPGTIGVYTSLDGFSASIHTLVQPDATFVNSQLDLSSLGAVSGSFRIRLREIGDTQADGVGATAATGTFRVADFTPDGGATFVDTQVTGTLIPEPTTALLLVAGLAGLAAAGRPRATR